jgi:acyl-CoA synthetase (NDP forming)
VAVTHFSSELDPLWSARSVAIVGASNRPDALGHAPVRYLLRFGYSGRILPVNPSTVEILGLPCYPSVKAAPGPVDLALLLVAAERVPAALEDCITAGVPVVVVMSSGFAETGADGARAQAELVRRAREAGVRVLGPNCIGAVGTAAGLVASFSPLFASEAHELIPGPIGFVSSSGALGYGAVSLATERGLGLGWIVNTGNEADITALEALTAIARQPECSGVLGFLESLSDGSALRTLAASGKPVALLKAGRGEAGARAAASHTGALATPDRVIDAALRQLGIVRACDIDDLLDIGEAFAAPRRPAGPRLGIVTTSGGSGILAADEVERCGLRLSALGSHTLAELHSIVPAFGSAANPVDVTATVMKDITLFDRCLEIVAADDDVDMLIACFCVLTGDDVDSIVGALSRVVDRCGKPVLAARTGADYLAPKASAALRAFGIPAYPTPARAVRAAAALWQVSQPSSAVTLTGRGIPAPERGATESDLKEILAAAGIPVPVGRGVDDADDAVRAVADVGGRAVLKAIVPGLVHKTEAGAVVLDVTPETAPAVFQRLVQFGGEVRVEQQVDGAVEMLVGIAPSPLGPVITIGAGGVLTEVLDDVALRLLPVSELDVRDMLRELKSARLLEGARGRPPADVDAFVALVLRLAECVHDWPEGYELDLNPVAVLPHGALVLDAAYVPRAR